MKEFIIVVSISIFIAVNIIVCVDGVMSAQYHFERCDKSYNIDYIFPARKLGCWLGKETE